MAPLQPPEDNKPTVTTGDVGHHYVLFSGDDNGFGDVVPPLSNEEPLIIPTAGDADDHDRLDRRWKALQAGTGTFWDDDLAHKYRTWSILVWNWQRNTLTIEVNGVRQMCNLSRENDKNSDKPVTRKQIEECIDSKKDIKNH